jgi:hypothetical protein
VKRQIFAKMKEIDRLESWPHEALKGRQFKGLFKLRVGDYRLIYRLVDGKHSVVVLEQDWGAGRVADKQIKVSIVVHIRPCRAQAVVCSIAELCHSRYIGKLAVDQILEESVAVRTAEIKIELAVTVVIDPLNTVRIELGSGVRFAIKSPENKTLLSISTAPLKFPIGLVKLLAKSGIIL